MTDVRALVIAFVAFVVVAMVGVVVLAALDVSAPWLAMIAGGVAALLVHRRLTGGPA